MNNNIYITLASPSVSAPDTGAFSSVHNGTTGTNGSNSILILSGLAILILIVAMAILLLVKKCNKDRKSNGRNHKGPFIRLLSRKATLFTCLMLLFSLAFATAFVVHKSADKTANATPADPSESNALTITVDDVRETIETNSSGVYCAGVKVHLSLLAAFAVDHALPLVKVNIPDIQMHQFSDTHTS